MRFTHSRRQTASVVLFTTVVLLSCLGSPSSAASGEVRIEVVSTRAGLVTDGDALLRVRLPPGADAKGLRVDVNGRSTSPSTLAEPGSVLVSVTGLREGRNAVQAELADGRGARLEVTNHPKGGPLVSGPQLQPWTCTTTDNGLAAPIDDQCNAPTVTSYLYQPTDAEPGAYEAYDPSDPPDDVATTRTSNGMTVPYIIRVELGTLDRSIYRTMVLADPSKPWTATRPQPQWDRKLVVAFGGGCGTPYGQKPPNPRGPIFGNTAGDGDIQLPELLSRGTMTGATGLNTLMQNCNPVLSAEAMLMLKEHVIDSSGEVRRTLTVGGSGGSVQQHYIASNYPGLTDGIVPTISFPDLQGMTWDAADCYLTTRYFTTVSPHLWPVPEQKLAVQGKNGQLSCGEFVALFADWNDPQNRGAFQSGAGVRAGCGLPPGEAYNPVTNPTGPRCSVQDYQRNIWGHGGPRDAAPLPFDNTGVQYGLRALQDGTITPAQFLDLNAQIGTIDNEGGFAPGRSSMSDEMAATFFRSGQTTDAHRLADVPIIDVREAAVDSDPEGFSDLHQPYNTRAMRARLDAANGGHGNQVVWYPPPANIDVAAVTAVDRWLDAVDRDQRPGTQAQKIVRDRPADIRDTCWIDNEPVTDVKRCSSQYPPARYGGTARIAAGGPLSSDVRKCQLAPPRRSDYPTSMTDAEWAQLKTVFPRGVCDYTRPSVGQQRAVAWPTFDVPGGRPLGPEPRSVAYHATGAPSHPSRIALPSTGMHAVVPVMGLLLLVLAGIPARRSRKA